jgi:hypothetical protein
MRRAVHQEIARSDESRDDHRLHGLLLRTGGHSCQQVADLVGENRRTVQRWVTRFATQRLSGLRDGVRLGRPATLNPTQWAALGGASATASWPHGIPAAQSPTSSRPVRPGQGLGV